MSDRHLEDLQEMEREAQSRHEKDAARIAALEAELAEAQVMNRRLQDSVETFEKASEVAMEDAERAEAEVERLREDRHNRWVTLRATSSSGKTLFSCKCCGRVSLTPDNECRTFADPGERWACSAWLPDMDPLKQEGDGDDM